MYNLNELLEYSNIKYQICEKFQVHISCLLNKCNGTQYIQVSKLIKDGLKNDYSSIKSLNGVSGIYIFLLDNHPMYVGVGKSTAKNWGLKQRISQHLAKNNKYGTLRSKIHKIDKLLFNKEISEDYVTEKIKLFHLLTIITASSQDAIDLESILIAILSPMYNG